MKCDKQMKAITNAKLLINDEIVEGKTLLFDNKIVNITEGTDLEGIETIDAKGAYVSAGFIDLHIHGSGGSDVMDATPTALETLSTTLLHTGTTSFLATTMTMSVKAIDKALQNIQRHASKVTGANILGIHLEGPFINASKHGAQDKAYVQPANMALIKNYMEEIKMITLAPEVEGGEDFIKLVAKEYPHIILSIGHSDASYEAAQESFTWGISHATHLFNAMNPYHHRKPGIVGAVFDSDVTCDIIADLVHTHPTTLELVQKIKKEKLILITDAMRAGCMKCGIYDLGGQRVEVDGGKAVLEDGTLAGSILKMNEALSNMSKHTSMELVEIVNAVTKIPAAKLGILKGVLREGYDADIVIFDENFSIISTIVNGEVKYRR
ncbi:N-acetylglucosamine-6-phosphate deacetylase [Sulfurovum sp. AR]|uniref:N-acetylglucosamine-6-phosphate deacetylase n=1 Tax=Sulfurovum sp. AR TaxID=1165841 RepID=UPI00025C4F3B|nr:N-acetylglucosamine-6-phosphate deacetylase [Sulfurovum sp. AR]EIF50675.1 N-acetylglucosamine-6-phosphate deacetylase [Sulfurovum sp. AR]